MGGGSDQPQQHALRRAPREPVVVAAVDLAECAGVRLAFAPVAVGAAAPVAWPVPVGDAPAAQGFRGEGQRVVFGQHRGGHPFRVGKPSP